MTTDLLKKKCVPCEGGVPPMTPEESHRLLAQATGWELDTAAKKISKRFVFKDFVQAMAFLNRVAALAEEEGHHPDARISYNEVLLELTTHALGGLSENDFIVAAKINQMNQP